jgi:hypothetical protein
MYKIPFPWLLSQSIHMYLRTCFHYTFKACCILLAMLAASNKLNNISCTETRLIYAVPHSSWNVAGSCDYRGLSLVL